MKSGIVENNQQRFLSVVCRSKAVEVNERPYSDVSWLFYPPIEPRVCCMEAAVGFLYHVKDQVNISKSEQQSKKFINQVSLSVMTEGQILNVFRCLKYS